MSVYIRPSGLSLLLSEEPITKRIVYHTRVCTKIEDYDNNIHIELNQLTIHDPDGTKLRQCEVCLNPDYETIYDGGKHWPEDEIAGR